MVKSSAVRPKRSVAGVSGVVQEVSSGMGRGCPALILMILDGSSQGVSSSNSVKPGWSSMPRCFLPRKSSRRGIPHSPSSCACRKPGVSAPRTGYRRYGGCLGGYDSANVRRVSRSDRAIRRHKMTRCIAPVFVAAVAAFTPSMVHAGRANAAPASNAANLCGSDYQPLDENALYGANVTFHIMAICRSVDLN
jgi:hypothetical protein